MNSELLHIWLPPNNTANDIQVYDHNHLKENSAARANILTLLTDYVRSSHEESRTNLRKILGINLDSGGANYNSDPILNFYPKSLPPETLKGYFGEIFSSILAQHYQPCNESSWEVPAFLFRNHKIAFQYLEKLIQGGTAHQIPGKHGEDMVAFVRDSNKNIIKVLYCEAKCLAQHNVQKVKEAHEKISGTELVPTTTLEYIEIMRESTLEDASDWVNALIDLRTRQHASRFDAVVYITGNLPVRASTWIPLNIPHVSYSANRRLQVFEVHIEDVSNFVLQIYGGV